MFLISCFLPVKFEVHEENASSSTAALLNDDIPLSILSSQVFGERHTASLLSGGKTSFLSFLRVVVGIFLQILFFEDYSSFFMVLCFNSDSFVRI